MGDALIGLGVLLAVLGPILLLPVVWALYRFVFSRFFEARWQAVALSSVLVVGALAATYIPGKRAFEDRCAAQGRPSIARRVQVEGFYRTALFPYEAVDYLTQGGFQFVEAPDPYKEDVLLRYTLGSNGQVKHEETSQLQSIFGVRKAYALLDDGVSMSEKRIYELATDIELAHAAEYVYHGGPFAIFLGTLGMSSCPDILTEQGSKDFKIFYDLEKIVLQGQPLP